LKTAEAIQFKFFWKMATLRGFVQCCGLLEQVVGLADLVVRSDRPHFSFKRGLTDLNVLAKRSDRPLLNEKLWSVRPAIAGLPDLQPAPIVLLTITMFCSLLLVTTFTSQYFFANYCLSLC
jgi:hypothetical protein